MCSHSWYIPLFINKAFSLSVSLCSRLPTSAQSSWFYTNHFSWFRFLNISSCLLCFTSYPSLPHAACEETSLALYVHWQLLSDNLPQYPGQSTVHSLPKLPPWSDWYANRIYQQAGNNSSWRALVIKKANLFSVMISIHLWNVYFKSRILLFINH